MSGRGYLAALDIGGTHARLALRLPGRQPRFYTAPGFTLLQNGPEQTARRCAELLLPALAQLGQTPQGCAALCCGAAGVDSEADRRAYKRLLTGLGFAPQQVWVYNDCELPLAALGRPALLVAAGTGSMALARDARGRFHRCGGWGFMTSDEASACRLALQGLTCAVRAWQGMCDAPVLTGLLAEQGVNGPAQAEALARAALTDKSRLAALAPLVCRAAQQGERPAARLVRREAAALGMCAAAAARKAQLCQPPLLLWGGLLTGAPALREPLVRYLQKKLGARPVPMPSSALEAALELAARQEEQHEFV